MTLHALVVDDNEVNLHLVRRVLEGYGFTVETVRDGMTAMAALDRTRPDVVVLDIMMPGMNGVEVLDRIKATPRLASIPVIMLTAKSADGDILDSYRSGADYYLTKPLIARQLVYGLGLVLGREFPETPTDSLAPSPPRPDRSR